MLRDLAFPLVWYTALWICMGNKGVFHIHKCILNIFSPDTEHMVLMEEGIMDHRKDPSWGTPVKYRRFKANC